MSRIVGLTAGSGMLVANSDQTQLNTTFIADCERGIDVSGANNSLSIRGNVVSKCKDNGIQLEAGVQPISNLNIEYNTIYGCDNHGLTISGPKATGVLVTSNVLVDNAAANFSLTADCTGLTFERNIIGESANKVTSNLAWHTTNELVKGPQLFIQARIRDGESISINEMSLHRPLRDSAARSGGRVWPAFRGSKDLSGTPRGDNPDKGALEYLPPDAQKSD